MIKDRIIIADGTQNETINSENLSHLFDIKIDVIKYKGNWHIYRSSK